MTNWITEEHGNRTFTHAGWTVIGAIIEARQIVGQEST